MKVEDDIYGDTEIQEPALIELLNSSSVLRLRGIQQYGIPRQYYETPGFTRYDHSVGVMILLRMLGAGICEQIAGLLHDVSHTAFSHVTDYVFGDSEKAQDARHKDYLLSTELPEILSRYGLDPAHVADIDAHPLLEREAPDLCADRVDYVLRELALTPKRDSIGGYLDNLLVFDGKIVFSDFEVAVEFGQDYARMHDSKWAGVEKTIRQHLFATAIRTALDCGDITVSDLFEDDEHALRKLLSSDDLRVRGVLDLLSQEPSLNGSSEPDMVLPRRQRHVDPHFISNGGLTRVTERSLRYRKMLELQRKRLSKGAGLRIPLRFARQPMFA